MHVIDHWRQSLLLAVLGAAFLAAPASAQRGGRGGAPQEGLAFRFMGPAVGNRIAAAAGVPGDLNTYYAGAASGGVWKSTDGGARWVPVSDSLPVAAIGALAVSASNHNIVWAGTGEAWAIRDVDMMGDGIYKSTDAGQNWTHMGLTETGRIGRIVIHPSNPDIVFACAAGRLTGPQQERGVFRTTDGGKNWERVLFADPNTGCSGLDMDAHDPNVLFAGTWQVGMHTYAMFSGGPGSGVYVSRDGGTTWKRIEGHGLPKPPVGKIDVAIAAKNPKRVYALIQTADQGSLWLRRWRRKLDRGQLAAGLDRPRRVLHPCGRVAGQSGRSPGGQQQLLAVHRRRQDVPQPPLGRRHARHLDRSHQRRPHPRHP